MKRAFTMLIMIAGSAACAHASTVPYPSCDLPVQHAVSGERVSTDPGANQEHLQIRADVLEGDINAARAAGGMSETHTKELVEKLRTVREESADFARQQGFVSAGERASYERQLDAIAAALCGDRLVR